jgi:hypothetical protein
MPAKLMALSAEVARWGPMLPVALVLAVALLQAVVLPRRLWAKAAWVLLVVLYGAGAGALLHWQQSRAESVQTDRSAAETAALRGLWSQWDALSQELPEPPGDKPAASFDGVDDALASLSAKVASVQTQVAALKAGQRARSVEAEKAAKLADYLRQFGSYRAVVSCVAGDVEAYTYANQLANILRAAGWDANGPEATTWDEGAAAMGISLFVRNPAAPDAAKILVDAFTRFNIPYQSGVGSSDAIPDDATVELFVAKKP